MRSCWRMLLLPGVGDRRSRLRMRMRRSRIRLLGRRLRGGLVLSLCLMLFMRRLRGRISSRWMGEDWMGWIKPDSLKLLITHDVLNPSLQ